MLLHEEKTFNRSVVSDAQSLPREHGRRIHVDGVEQTARKQRIATGENHLSVAALQGDADHLKDIRGLHLLGEAINVGVDRGVVLHDLAADPLGRARERPIDLHGEGHHASLTGVLVALLGVSVVSDEPGNLAILKVSRARRIDDSDVDIGENSIVQ